MSSKNNFTKIKKKAENNVKIINSVSELHNFLSLPKPLHPLISRIYHSDCSIKIKTENQIIALNFYNISIKKGFKGQMKYGKYYYDFDEGIMSFVSPKQVFKIYQGENRSYDGWSLVFHPDLIRNHPLEKLIKHYGYFSYEVNEALHLSIEEEAIVENLVKNIELEYHSIIDRSSTNIIVANILLLLDYCNRFYKRQFVTRKIANNDLLTNFENILARRFEENTKSGLPTVNSLAEEMNLSSGYLSDMLRTVTGQNTQQHIHNKLIEKAKEMLTTTNLKVNQVAFQLGFKYPQSFNKLFKIKTKQSPNKFRKLFNNWHV